MGLDLKMLPGPIKAYFNAISQVVFIENVFSGFAFWISFFVAGLEMTGWNFGDWQSWKYGVYVAIGVNISNFTAFLMGCDRGAIASGLYGFSSNLVSIGVGVFGGNWWTEWIALGMGTIVVVPIHIFINKFANHFGLPGFTLPFIVTTWFMILISYNSDWFFYDRAGALASGSVDGVGGVMYGYDWSGLDWGLFLTNGFEEIWVLDGWIASLICIAGYLWADWQFGVKACLAQAFTIGFGLLFSVQMNLMQYSLYGYSTILTVGGLDTFGKSKKNSGRYWFLFAMSCVMTCLVNYAIGGVLGTFGLPNCTLAFVLTGWMVLIVERFMIERAEARALERGQELPKIEN